MKREDYISDRLVVKRANEAVRIELEKKKAMDIPSAVYDRQKQKIYQLNSDGTRKEIGDRMRKGHYSERKEKNKNSPFWAIDNQFKKWQNVK